LIGFFEKDRMEVPAGLDDWIERAGASFYDICCFALWGWRSGFHLVFDRVRVCFVYIQLSSFGYKVSWFVNGMQFYALVSFSQASHLDLVKSATHRSRRSPSTSETTLLSSSCAGCTTGSPPGFVGEEALPQVADQLEPWSTVSW
jgi:hypothetical protein